MLNGVIATDIKENDTVICKNSQPLPGNEVAPPLTNDNEYPVKEVHQCECGQKHINVGLPSNYSYVRCYNCETQLPNGDTIHWCHPSRFEIKA